MKTLRRHCARIWRDVVRWFIDDDPYDHDPIPPPWTAQPPWLDPIELPPPEARCRECGRPIDDEHEEVCAQCRARSPRSA